MKNVFWGCIILMSFVCGLFAQTVPDEVDSNYIIGEEDVISITVRNEPEFSVSQRSVRMDGRVTLPMLGEIHASGKTAKQLEGEIARRLELFLKSPIVIVVVDRVLSQRVTVAGQVATQGLYAIGSPTTVLEILVRAGGLTQFAREKQIRIVRIVDGREVQFPFNYRDVIRGRNMQQNILLQNRDYIMVP